MQLTIPLGGKYCQINIEEKGSQLRVSFRYHKQLVEEVKAMEGARWEPNEKVWYINNSERNLVAINQLEHPGWPLYDKPLPEPLHFNNAMVHQAECANHILARKRVIIAGEMGIGKTLAALLAMDKVKGEWWVVCPKTAKWVWLDEINKWKFPFIDGRNIRIFHYEKLEEVLTRLQPNQWCANILFDEAHKLKNYQTKRTQAAALLTAHVRNKGGYVVLMTGTPSPKDPSDWWAYCELCQPGFLRESSRDKLKRRLANIEYVQRGEQAFDEEGRPIKSQGYPVLRGWKEDEIKLLYKRMAGMVWVKFKKDCIDLPPKIYIERRLPFTEQHKKYINLIKDTATSALDLLNKLRQFSDGFFPESNEIIETPKDEALQEYLEEERDRLVIFAAFHKSIDKICQMAHVAGWQVIKVDGRGTIGDIRSFQSDSKDKICYVGHPDAGGLSITLTKSDTIIYYSNSFKGDARRQSEDRIHRIGTSKATIIDLLWLPSDDKVLANLKLKRNLELLSLGEVKEWLN